MLTRTSGVLAFSDMLAVGACCAKAVPDCISTASKTTHLNDLRVATNSSSD
jgi:hypothetical protein